MPKPQNTFSIQPSFLNSVVFLLAVFFSSTNFAGPFNSDFESPFLSVDEAFVPQYEFTQSEAGNALLVHFAIAEDYYLYKNKLSFYDENNNKLSLKTQMPSAKTIYDDYFGDVEVYFTELSFSLFLPEALNGTELSIKYQGCALAGLCYPPKKLTIPLFFNAKKSQTQTSDSTSPEPKTTPEKQPESSRSLAQSIIQSDNLFISMGLFFLLGLGLTFTPCVLPMLPILSAAVLGNKNQSPLRNFSLASSYVLGMALTYTSAGVIIAQVGAQFNLQLWLQHPLAIATVALIFTALAASMLGMFELQLPSRWQNALNDMGNKQKKGQLAGLFFLGAISALVVSPCITAPMAGALIFIASTGDTVTGASILFALSMGMGIPLILFCVGADKLIPKSGAWMETVKKLLGLLLLAIAISLVQHLLPSFMKMFFWANYCFLIAWVLGVFKNMTQQVQQNSEQENTVQVQQKTFSTRLIQTIGLTALGYGVVIFIGAMLGNANPLRPLEKTVTQNHEAGYFVRIEQAEELQTLLDEAKAQNKMAVVDFYADWCKSCVVYEQEVFNQAEVISALTPFLSIKADITAVNSSTQAIMSQYELVGLPSILFFDSNGKEIRSARIEGEMDAISFKNHVKKLLMPQTASNL